MTSIFSRIRWWLNRKKKEVPYEEGMTVYPGQTTRAEFHIVLPTEKDEEANNGSSKR